MFEHSKMYARFTDRARKVMQLANQEAQRFNHEYIGTEHILLGLVKEGSGVAANVLKNLDIDLRKIRLEVEKIVQSGPDMVAMGQLKQTPRAKRVIECAIDEARYLNHNYVGTEHLLLGLLREQEGVAAQVLMNLGLKLDDVREEVLSLLGLNITKHKCRTCGKPMLRHTTRRGPFLGCSGYPECKTTMEVEQAKMDLPLASASERIQSLEHQLANMRWLLEAVPEDRRNEHDPFQPMWNVRVVLGALAGALAGALLAAATGAVLGLILGGGMAALGRRIPAALAGGITGILIGSAHLSREGGGLAGALLGALVGFLIAEIGGPPDGRGLFRSHRKR